VEVLASVNSSSLCIRTNWRSWENCKFGLPLFPLRISFVGYNRSLRKDFQAFKKEHCQRAVCSASVAGYIGLDSELMPRGWSNCTLMRRGVQSRLWGDHSIRNEKSSYKRQMREEVTLNAHKEKGYNFKASGINIKKTHQTYSGQDF